MKRYKVRNVLVLVITLFAVLIVPLNTHADKTRSLIGDLASRVLGIQLSDGSLMETNEQKNKRYNINTDILNGRANKEYSLYDRFGPNIQYVPYYGEQNIQTNVLDKLYTRINERNFKGLTPEEIVKTLQKPKMSSNNFTYKGRAEVLTKKEVDGGKVDPRVSALSEAYMTGSDAGLGNLELNVSKYITYFTAFLSGSGLYQTTDNVWKYAWDSNIGSWMTEIMKGFYPFFGAIFIVFLAIRSFQYAKGHRSGKDLFSYALAGIVSGGILLAFMYNPNSFSNVTTKVVTIADEVLDTALSENGDEVIQSDDKSNVRQAAIWEKTVFIPWSKGMFNSDYHKLYSTFQKGYDSSGLTLSNDNIQGEWNKEETRSNTTKALGNPIIQLGGNKTISNWGAFAWSTQSIYHISPYNLDEKTQDDKKKDDKDKKKEENKNKQQGIWPIENTTPNNAEIYLDDFRWVDALMNVSYEFKGGGDSKFKQIGYDHSRAYQHNFGLYGAQSVWLSLLTIPILILGFRKLKISLIVIVSGVLMMWNTARWFLSPDYGYDFFNNIRRVFGYLGRYLWTSLIMFVMIMTYLKIPMNPIGTLVWLMLSIYLLTLKTPANLPSRIQWKNLWNKVKNQKHVQIITKQMRESSMVNHYAREEAKQSSKERFDQESHSTNENGKIIKNNGVKKDSFHDVRKSYKEIKRQYYNDKDE